MATTVPDTSTIGAIIATTVPSAIASALPSAITTTAPVTATSIGLPITFEVAATLAGALTGAMLGVTRRFDITGVFMLALVNGLGGGIIRDLLLQDQGIFALDHPRALISVLVAATFAFFFLSFAERLRPAVKVLDAFSLALFCLVGADKALVGGLSILPAILLGVTTSIGGGVLRDVLTGEIPQVMRRGSYYATAAVVGSSVYVFGTVWLNLAKPVALVLAGLITFGLRVGSLWRGWETPVPRDLTPVVVEAPRGLWHRGRQLIRPRPKKMLANPTPSEAPSCPTDAPPGE